MQMVAPFQILTKAHFRKVLVIHFKGESLKEIATGLDN